MNHPQIYGRTSFSWRSFLLPVAALLFAIFAMIQFWPHTLDDAYISLVYARNLAEGNGLVFNLGERVEGFSNPLWVLFLALTGWFRLPWVTTAKVLGALAALTTCGVTWWLMFRWTSTISSPSSSPRTDGRDVRSSGKKRRKGKSGKDRQSGANSTRQGWLEVLRPAPFVAVALLVIHPGFLYYAVAGMETALFGCLVLLGVGLHLLDLHRHGLPTRRWCYLPLAAAAITRPEGPIFLVFVACHRLWLRVRNPSASATGPAASKESSTDNGHSSQTTENTEEGEQQTVSSRRALKPLHLELLAVVAAFAVPALYLVFRLLYFQDWLPNTYYAKPGTFWSTPAGAFRYVTTFFQTHVTPPLLFGGGKGLVQAGLWVLGLGLLGLVVRAVWHTSTRRIATTLLAVALCYMGFILYVGGDWMIHSRLFQPILPFLYMLPALGLATLATPLRNRLGFVLLLLLPLQLAQPVQVWRDLNANQRIDHAHSSQNNVKMARWLARHLPPGSSLVTDEIGAMGFYTRFHIHDPWGLIDRSIARILHRERFNPNNAVPPYADHNDPKRHRIQREIAALLLRRAPNYVLVDYNGPPPRAGRSYRPEQINSLTMTELYNAIRYDYRYVRGFSLMRWPFKTFLLFRRTGTTQPPTTMPAK